MSKFYKSFYIDPKKYLNKHLTNYWLFSDDEYDDDGADYNNDNFFDPSERREAERALKEQEALHAKRRNKFA